MPQIYRHELVVPREAEDQNGHVNNVEYLRWMQDAAMRHSSHGTEKRTIHVLQNRTILFALDTSPIFH